MSYADALPTRKWPRVYVLNGNANVILTSTAGNFCVLFTANDGYTLVRRFLKADTRLSSRIVLRAAQEKQKRCTTWNVTV